jgi:hypothetical protein
MSNADFNKYKNWVFTYDLAGEEPSTISDSFILSVMKKIADSYAYQLEKGEGSGRFHYQGCFRTFIRKRQPTLLAEIKAHLDLISQSSPYKSYLTDVSRTMKGFTIDRMQGTWEQAQAYCSKSETSQSKTVLSPDLEHYSGEDINFLEEQKSRFYWQDSLFQEIFASDEAYIKDADSRTILWITDEHGCSGKSKFVKYACFSNPNCAKVSFGSSTQLRSSLIALGRKKVYFIDIPRTLGKDDHLEDLISVLEDLKNGFLVSCMYGKYQSLMMDPPHVIVFSNQFAPFNTMSQDRWRAFRIHKETKRLLEEPYGRVHY